MVNYNPASVRWYPSQNENIAKTQKDNQEKLKALLERRKKSPTDQPFKSIVPEIYNDTIQ